MLLYTIYTKSHLSFSSLPSSFFILLFTDQTVLLERMTYYIAVSHNLIQQK